MRRISSFARALPLIAVASLLWVALFYAVWTRVRCRVLAPVRGNVEEEVISRLDATAREEVERILPADGESISIPLTDLPIDAIEATLVGFRITHTSTSLTGGVITCQGKITADVFGEALTFGVTIEVRWSGKTTYNAQNRFVTGRFDVTLGATRAALVRPAPAIILRFVAEEELERAANEALRAYAQNLLPDSFADSRDTSDVVPPLAGGLLSDVLACTLPGNV